MPSRLVLLTLCATLPLACDRPGGSSSGSGGEVTATTAASAGSTGGIGTTDGGGATTGGATTGGATTGGATTGDPPPTPQDLFGHDQVFGCDIGAEQARLTIYTNGTLGIEERNGTWSDSGTWTVVGDTVELSVAGMSELVEMSETYQGQVIEFQSPSLDCIILALPQQNLLAGTTFECSTIGFEKAFYSFNTDGAAGRSTEVNFTFDSWLETEGGVYWMDLPNNLIHMIFPLTDPRKDEVVESALILDDTSFEVLSPSGNQVGEVCNLK